MKNIYLILILLLILKINGFADDQCFICHSEGVEDKPGKLFSGDVHRLFGVTCADCHGGSSASDDMDEAMDKAKGFIGVPAKKDIPKLCLKCHLNSDKMKQFGSDKPVDHLKYFLTGVHGKTEILTCVTCHGIHNIKKPTDPKSPVYPTNEVKLCSSCHSDANYMKQFNPSLPTDQYDKYLTSIHGQKNRKGDIKTATCSDCHSPHNIFPSKDPRARTFPFNLPKACAHCHSNKEYMKEYGIPTNQYDLYTKSVHGKALFDKHDATSPTCNDCHGNHGAVPVGIENISHICGTCHVLNAEMFSQSPHADYFRKKNIPQCEVCHSNHYIKHPTDEMLGTAKQSVCIKCHNDENDKGFLAVLDIKGTIDSLLISEKEAFDILKKAENLGMDIQDARYDLDGIGQILITSRTIIHKANLEEFNKTIKPGIDIVDRAYKDGKAALNEFYFRRYGLGASTLIITILAISLFIKIKRIEKKQAIEKNK